MKQKQTNNTPKLSFSVILLMICGLFTNCKTQHLATVPYVDLKKYCGKWFEIASYPQTFQKGCHCTTATYTYTENGYVVVENSCRS